MLKFASVVIPVYNDRENLKKCLHALFNTEYRGFEVLVVDDGSSDNLEAIAKEFNCRLIKLSCNSGQAYARNVGVRESNGKIILFTDSDCIVMKDWVKKFVEEIERAEAQLANIAVVCGRLEQKKDFFSMCHAYSGYAYVQGGQRREMKYLNTSNTAVFKEAFDKVGGFSGDMKVSEDPELGLKLTEAGYKIIFEPTISVFHDHGIENFRSLVLKHKKWGEGLGLMLELKHSQRLNKMLPFLLNPLSHFLLIVPLALATTCRIVLFNRKTDKSIWRYAFFIFLSKVFFRWGIFIWSLKNLKTRQDWKKQDKFYHEDKSVVTTYDFRITRKYVLEHKYFTLYKWVEALKDSHRSMVLDFGCGTGNATFTLLKNGIRTVSIDASLTMLRETKRKADNAGLKTLCVVADAENLPFKDACFDGLICGGVLHHIPDIEKGLNNQVRVLQKQGLLFIAEPFREKPWFSYPYFFLVVFVKFLLGIFKRNKAASRERLISRRELNSILDILTKNNFEYNLRYFVYWPLICGYLPESIALPLTHFINMINRKSNRADTIIISAKKLI